MRACPFHLPRLLFTPLLPLLLCAFTATAQEHASIADVVHRTIEEEGVEQAIATYHNLRRSAPDAYDFAPSELNVLGYRLLNEGRTDAAVRILRLNTELYPLVANGYDSLAEIYLWRGDYDEAVASYERLLDVAPRDTVASSGLLRRLVDRATTVTEAYRRIEGEVAEPLLSPRLRALSDEVEEHGERAIDAFREERGAAGGPLVEPIDGDPQHRLVTFFWFEEDALDHVVVESWLGGRSLEQRVMEKLPGTPLWFKTYRVPAGLRMGYLLSPNDRRLSPYASLLTGDMRASTWVRDPLNPDAERGEGNRVWSVLELPGAPPAPWLHAEVEVPDERISEFEIESVHLDEPWEVVVYTPPGFQSAPQDAYPLLVFFDGFGFANVDRTHALLETMITRGELPPVVAAFVYNPGSTRSRDMSCYEPTHAFLEEDLVPRLRRDYRSGLDPAETAIVGRSRSGLGAACAASHLPEVFGHVIAQSGSFWWAPDGEETEWLARTLAASPPQPVTLYLEAGLLEDDPNPATGLSMLTVTRHLRDVAVAKGYEVHYHEIAGGHDPTAWRATLPRAFSTLFRATE